MPITREQHRTQADGGPEVAVTTWRGEETPTHQLLIVHGLLEHGLRYDEYARHLAERGVHVVAPDMQGHGRTGGRRGHVNNYGEFFHCIEQAKQFLVPDLPSVILGHSNGGLITTAYLADSDRGFCSAIISNPGLKLAAPPPFLTALKYRIMGRLSPRRQLPFSFPGEILTHDASIAKAYDDDPLVLHGCTAGLVREMLATQNRLQGLDGLPLPFMFIISEEDVLADPVYNRMFAERISGPDDKVMIREGEFHEPLNELDRHSLYADTHQWIVETSSARHA